MDRDAVVQQHSLPGAVLEHRPDPRTRRVEAIGAAGDKLLLARPGRSWASGDAATDVAMTSLAARFEEGGKAGVLQDDIFHRATLAVGQLNDAAAAGGAGHQPVIDRHTLHQAIHLTKPEATVPEPFRRLGAAVAGADLEQAGLPVDHVVGALDRIDVGRVPGVDLPVAVFALGIRAERLDAALRERDAGELQRSALDEDTGAFPQQDRTVVDLFESDRDPIGVNCGVAPTAQYDVVASRGRQPVAARGDR